MDKFSYTPDEVFNDTSAYSDPQSESEVREQLTRPHKQIEEYINNKLLPAVASGDTNIQSQIDDTLTPAIEARMKTATYDTNGNGIVDNAEKVNNHTVDADVPSNAVFTDTTYKQASETVMGIAKMYSGTGTGTDGSMTQKAVTDAIQKAAFGDITIDTEMSDTSENPVQNKTVKQYVDDHTTWDGVSGKPSTYPTTWDEVSGKPSTFPPTPSVTKSILLEASSWSSATYTINDSLITATSNQEIIPSQSITADQYKALVKASLVATGQTAGSITIKAFGATPTIDIPVTVIFRGEGGGTVTSCPFPIGSIYLSVTDANPSETFPGTAWKSIGTGRVLQGADDAHAAGETIEAGIPNIKAELPMYYGGNFSSDNLGDLEFGFCWANKTMTQSPWGIPLDASNFSDVYGRSDTVQPPALAVYMWQRTA